MKWVTTIILLLAGWLLFALYQQNQKTDLAAEYRYAYHDTDEVSKIKLNYRLMDPDILLEKQNGFWHINGKYRARQDAIENILEAIRKIELQYIPNAAAKRNMITDLAATGTKVELFDDQDKILRAYFIGGTTPDERGTYIIMDGSQSPAIVSLTGFEGSIRPFFIMPELDWRDRIIYREDPSQIVEISLDYPAHRESSFSIRKQDGGFNVFPLDDQLKTSALKSKKGAVEAYFQRFKSVGAESLMDNKPLANQLMTAQPFAIITIRRSDQTSHQARFYPVIRHEDEAVNQAIDRYHLLDGEGNLYLVQHLLFGKLFLGLDYFFEE